MSTVNPRGPLPGRAAADRPLTPVISPGRRDVRVETDDEAAESRPVRAIRDLERRIGTYRPGRSPWVWILGPGLNLVFTTAGVLWVGLANGLGWLVSVPLALFCGIAMGVMAGAFMGTSWEAEEDERRAAEALARERENAGGGDERGA
jgi:hypothetical protein